MGARTVLPKLKTGTSARATEAPASVAQLRWLDTGSSRVHEQWLPFVWRMNGPLDVRVFLSAFHETIGRHDILHTRYSQRGGAWLQIIDGTEMPFLRPIDMVDADARVRELLIWQRLMTFYDAPASLDHGPVRFELFRTGADSHVFAGFLHHVVVDNASIRILFRDLMESYARRVSGVDPLPPPELQYSDFALWEASWLRSGGRKEAVEYWKNALARAKPFQLPGGRERGAPPGAWARQEFDIPSDIVEEVRKDAGKSGSTVAIVFQAALCLALARWVKQDQVLLGSFTEARPPGFGPVLGCFTQLRPLFVDLGGDPRLSVVLERTREAAMAVADFRKPVESEVLERLGAGAIILNYVRSSRRDARPAHSAITESLGPGDRGDFAMDEGAEPVAVSSRDFGVHAAGEAWPSPHSASAAMSLSSPGRDRVSRGLSFGMSRLPRPLQSRFSKDLHIGVLENNTGINVKTTVADPGIDPARVAEMMTDIVSFLPLLIAQGHRKASTLIR